MSSNLLEGGKKKPHGKTVLLDKNNIKMGWGNTFENDSN